MRLIHRICINMIPDLKFLYVHCSMLIIFPTSDEVARKVRCGRVGRMLLCQEDLMRSFLESVSNPHPTWVLQKRAFPYSGVFRKFLPVNGQEFTATIKRKWCALSFLCFIVYTGI